MIKLQRLFTLLAVVGVCASSYAFGASSYQNYNQPICCDDSYNCCETDCCNKKGFSFDFRYLLYKANRQQLPFSGTIEDNPFGASYDGITIDDDSYKIKIADTDYGFGNGFAIGLGYGCCNDWKIGARYTYFYTSGSSSVGDPDSLQNNYFANLVDRSLCDDASIGLDNGRGNSAKEAIDLKLHMIDLDYLSTHSACNYTLNHSYGIRFASVNQNKDVFYTYNNNSEEVENDTYAIDMKNEMRAWGLRGATEFIYPLCNNKVSFFANGGLSLLLGSFDVTRKDVAFDEGSNEVEIRSYCFDYCQVVPVLELGVGLQFCFCNMDFTIGYEFTNWFNMFQHMDIPGWDDVDGATSSNRIITGDLSFDGLFFRLEKCF